MSSRLRVKMKNAVKGTAIGKKLRDMYQKGGFTKKNAEEAFDSFVEYTNLKPTDKKRIVDDMMVEAKKYSFGFDEYFMYHFYDMPHAQRREYCSDRERIS